MCGATGGVYFSSPEARSKPPSFEILSGLCGPTHCRATHSVTHSITHSIVPSVAIQLPLLGLDLGFSCTCTIDDRGFCFPCTLGWNLWLLHNKFWRCLSFRLPCNFCGFEFFVSSASLQLVSLASLQLLWVWILLVHSASCQ